MFRGSTSPERTIRLRDFHDNRNNLLRHIHRGWYLVIRKIGIHQFPLEAVADVFVQHRRQPLDDPTDDLAFNKTWIDRLAGVDGQRGLQYAHLTGFLVDLESVVHVRMATLTRLRVAQRRGELRHEYTAPENRSADKAPLRRLDAVDDEVS